MLTFMSEHRMSAKCLPVLRYKAYVVHQPHIPAGGRRDVVLGWGATGIHCMSHIKADYTLAGKRKRRGSWQRSACSGWRRRA